MMRSAVAACVALLLVSCVFATPLDDYVLAPDPVTKWVSLGHTYEWDHATGYLLNLTSQQWLTPADSSQPIWWHYMVVVVPKNNKFPDAALLWITGGGQGMGVPAQDCEDLEVTLNLVNATGSIAVALFNIPNEPITFPSDPSHKSRSEDGIIAFTWQHFINNTNEPDWLLRLPMTKACYAAMNATEQFVKQNNGLTVTRWMAAGASKRGWTTWTLGAVNPEGKLVAIIPIVMDALNLIANMHHMYRNLGGWTFAFSDYYAEGLTGEIDLPQMQEMANIIDAYAYLDRFVNLPKLVIDAGDDEFFQPDDNWLWWDNMTGEKHLLMLQNAEHSLITAIPEVLHSVGAFVEGVLTGNPRPSFTWQMNLVTSGNASIIVNETGSPEMATKAVMHWAENLTDKRRDFRWITMADDPSGICQSPFIPAPKHAGMCVQPIIWKQKEIPRNPDGTYTATMEAPTNGRWGAFFVTMHYQSPLWEDYLFSTQINIAPNTIPFPACYMESCKGTLV